MKVIIDTNVLISAVLRDRDPEMVILFIVEDPTFEWVASSEILDEYKGVLSRPKFGLPEESKYQWFQLIDSLTTLVNVEIEIDFPQDQKDAKFLACALSVNAEFFITGDRDFTEAQKLINTTIISVASFKRLVCNVQP